ncbi:MAG: insulinase family protein [Segetibacter sp.]
MPFCWQCEIFYDRHFLEIRTNNGLSYAPYAYFDGGLTPSANIGVSTTDPNKYIQVFNKLVDKTKKGFTEEEVRNMKTTYITSQYYKDETNAAQGSSLASNEVLYITIGDGLLTLNEELKNITSKDVTAAFNKYITNLSWVYQGDPAKVESKLYMQTDSHRKTAASNF